MCKSWVLSSDFGFSERHCIVLTSRLSQQLHRTYERRPEQRSITGMTFPQLGSMHFIIHNYWRRTLTFWWFCDSIQNQWYLVDREDQQRRHWLQCLTSSKQIFIKMMYCPIPVVVVGGWSDVVEVELLFNVVWDVVSGTGLHRSVCGWLPLLCC